MTNFYRYMNFNKLEYVEPVLSESKLYFSYPQDFKENDAYDCKTFDITMYRPIDIQQFLIETIKIERPDYGLYEQYLEYKKLNLLHPWYRNNPYYQNFAKFLTNNWKIGFEKGKFGILCLTIDPNNKKMWESYSDNYSGICIKLDTNTISEHLNNNSVSSYEDEESLNFLYKVEYVPKPIKIPFYNYSIVEPLKMGTTMLCTKLYNPYNFEKECRYIIPQCINKEIKFPDIIIEEVILGKNITSDNEMLVNKWNNQRKKKFPIIKQAP